MKTWLFASAAALALMTGIASAQTTSSQTTTRSTTEAPSVVAPTPVAPPVNGTLSTTETRRATGVNGSETESRKTTYGNANGAASDSSTTTTTGPGAPAATTTTKTSKTQSSY